MIHFVSQLLDTIHTGRWYVFEIYVMFVSARQFPLMALAGIFYFLWSRGWIQKYPLDKKAVTIVVTIYDENLKILEESLRKVKESLEYGTTRHFFIAIIDGFDKNPAKVALETEIAKRYANVVLVTNARHKKWNLRELLREARKRGRLEELLIFLDSDTIPRNKDVVLKLLAPFSDPRIGGTTTSQLVHDPKTWIQKISFWLEDARLNSSMAACSLFGQVACLPGRMYAVRTKLVEHRMDELVNDSFSYFGLMRRPAIAGDDRRITGFVLQAGYRTVLVWDACVTTTAPDNLVDTCGMWARWCRTFQGITIRSPWLIRFPVAFFVYWTSILVTLSTVYIVAVHWPLTYLLGHGGTPLWQALILAVFGMILTTIVRQFPHLWKYPRSLWVLPIFPFVMLLFQFICFWALLTQHLVGKWGGSRADAGGTNTAKKTAWVVYEDRPVSS